VWGSSPHASIKIKSGSAAEDVKNEPLARLRIQENERNRKPFFF
jgi:hypothetical protein